MEQRRVGNSEISVSAIGLGCVTFGREIDQETSFQIMDYALEQGINFFDTAEGYASGEMPSETVIGNWMRSRGTRNEVVLCTKVSIDGTSEGIAKAAQQSLERLGTDYVEIYKAHNSFPAVSREELLGALNELVVSGVTQVIGGSNFSTDQLQEALAISDQNGWARFQILQPPYSMARSEHPGHIDRPEAHERLFPLCVDEGVAITPYSPLGAGFLTGKYTADRSKFPKGTRFDVMPGHADIYFNTTNFEMVEKLRAKSEETGTPIVKLAMGWAMENSMVTSVLAGARRPAHLDNAIEAFEMDLSPELYKEMSSWGAGSVKE